MAAASLRISKIVNCPEEKVNDKEIFTDLIKQNHMQQNTDFNNFINNNFSQEQEKQDSSPQSQNFLTLDGSTPKNFPKNICNTEPDYEENNSFFDNSPHMFLPQYRVNSKRNVMTSNNLKSRSLILIPSDRQSKF